jgi:hypothetical protein
MITPKPIRIIKYVFAISLVVFFACSGCASAKKNYLHSRRDESLCDLSRLGKNKYFYSASYQRKLTQSTKKIARH